MSIPLDTPAAVMIRRSRCSTTRVPVGVAPVDSSVGYVDQCVVAVSPCSSPAAPSTSEPVHTDVVKRVVSCAVRTQSSTRSSVISGRVPTPPGNTMMSGRGISSNVASRVMPRKPFSLRTSPRSWPMNVMSKPGIRCSTSYGPMPSSAVNRGKSGIAICRAGAGHGVLLSWCRGGGRVVTDAAAREAAAVLVGRDAEAFDERAAQRLGGAEPAARGRSPATASVVSSSARRAASVRTRSTYWPGDSPTSAREHAGEVTRAHRRPRRERGDAVVAAPARSRSRAGARGSPTARRAASTPARRTATDRRGGAGTSRASAPTVCAIVGAVVLLDERQRQVDAGGDAGATSTAARRRCGRRSGRGRRRAPGTRSPAGRRGPSAS